MRRIPTSFSLDPELMQQVRRLQQDPVTGRTQYRTLSRLVEALLWTWVKQQDEPNTPTKKEPTS